VRQVVSNLAKLVAPYPVVAYDTGEFGSGLIIEDESAPVDSASETNSDTDLQPESALLVADTDAADVRILNLTFPDGHRNADVDGVSVMVDANQVPSEHTDYERGRSNHQRSEGSQHSHRAA